MAGQLRSPSAKRFQPSTGHRNSDCGETTNRCLSVADTTACLEDGTHYRPKRRVQSKQAHGVPSHNSKMVLPTVNLGPPNWTKSRTFVLKLRLEW